MCGTTSINHCWIEYREPVYSHCVCLNFTLEFYPAGTLTVNVIREVTSTMNFVAKIVKADARVRATAVQVKRAFKSLCRHCEACIKAD